MMPKSKNKIFPNNLLSGESGLTIFLGASAIIGIVEIVLVVLFAMSKSRDITISFLIIGVYLIPLIALLGFYKKALGIKKTILSFIIGTVFTWGLLYLIIFLIR